MFAWLKDLFGGSDILGGIDELVTSDEERGQIQVKLAEAKARMSEIEAKVATRLLELQSEAIAARTKIAEAEQSHGNLLSKSWRPLCSLLGFGYIVYAGYNELVTQDTLLYIIGSLLGIHMGGRSMEKTKRIK